ncbi:hypothetical protein Bhyg_13993, partial [Pseudolycoriella hygida]
MRRATSGSDRETEPSAITFDILILPAGFIVDFVEQTICVCTYFKIKFMRSTTADQKYFQHETWSCQRSLTKTNSESTNLLNAKKEAKKVSFVGQQPSTLDQEKRQLDSADSIGKEMTHFKPIRLMPLSAINISNKVIKIPSIRHTNQEILIFQAPVKSKFKPEISFKSRPSAFCLVSATKQNNQNQKPNKSQDISGTDKRKMLRRRNGDKSNKEKIICNIVLNKPNCQKSVQKDIDVKSAKMLRECENVGRTENGNGYDCHLLTKAQ